MTITTSLRKALKSAETEPKDAATVALAYLYAKQLDDEGSVSHLAPKLLDCLEALLLTPRARLKVVKDDETGHVSPLDELRAKRQNRAKDLHPTAKGANT